MFGVGDADFVSLPGTTRYEPLREAPDLYLDFMLLGERAWADPPPPVLELAELALEFTREYGPLENKRVSTLREMVDEAKTVARLGKSYLAITGDRPENKEAEELFWPRVLTPYGQGHGFDTGPELKPGSAALKRFIAQELELSVNLHLKEHTVWTQIRVIFGDPQQQPGYEPTYEPASLRGAIWAQFASLLLRKSVLVRCRFEKCRRLFEAPSPASPLRYCPAPDPTKDGCQIKANDRKKYLKRVAMKSKHSASKTGE